MKEFTEDFYINENGDVFRKYKIYTNNRGYNIITIRNYPHPIHRVLAEQYIPNPDNLPVVRHLDGNSQNNDLSNLAWGTHQDNEQDKLDHGTYYTRSTKAKLSEDNLKDIIKLYNDGVSVEELCDKYRLVKSTIYRVLKGQNWSHLTGIKYEKI